MKYHLGSEEQLTLPGLADQEERVPAVPSLKRKAPAKPASELAAIPYLVLDLSCGHVDLFGRAPRLVSRFAHPCLIFWSPLRHKNITCRRRPAWGSCAGRRSAAKSCRTS